MSPVVILLIVPCVALFRVLIAAELFSGNYQLDQTSRSKGASADM